MSIFGEVRKVWVDGEKTVDYNMGSSPKKRGLSHQGDVLLFVVRQYCIIGKIS